MVFQPSGRVIALTRFGYGPRGDGEGTGIAADPRGFLEAQVERTDAAVLHDETLPTTKDALQLFFDERAARKLERQRSALATAAATPDASAADGTVRSPDGMGEAKPAPDPSVLPPQDRSIFRRETLARIGRAIDTPGGFVERLVAFWSNHFCISAAKGGFARATAGAFERETIRPHVLGRFVDMLVAVESHPAMLHYLDNVRSIGPLSRAGQRSGHGLNENLGREILELHTLGAGAGYGQADVTGLARILTGWTVVGPPGKLGEPGTFVFNGNAHEPGPLSVLGSTYEQEGPAQGMAALAALARHPATAHHLATKLARAFVADDPPPALVARLAATFRDTEGDLRATALALIAAPESWRPVPARVKDPYEFLIGTHRLLAQAVENPDAVLRPLRNMGMALWQPPGPNGFATDAATWAAPEAMKLRLDLAATFARTLHDPPNPNDLLDRLCAEHPSEATRDAVARAESRAQGLALLLMSPEMQRS